MAKVLRPGPVAVESPAGRFDDGGADRSPAVVRPAESGGDENLRGSGLEDLANDYRSVEDQLDEAEATVKTLKQKLALREEMMIELMQAKKIPNVKCRGKVLYLNDDLIVSKASGVSTEQLVEVLRGIGFGDLVADAVNANTLKATVKEYRRKAEEAAQAAPPERASQILSTAYYCRKCERYALGDELALEAGIEPACSNDHDPEQMLPVIHGVPSQLSAILYQEKKTRLGSRKS